MRRLSIATLLGLALAFVGHGASAADKAPDKKPTNPYQMKLPVPDLDIPVDLTVWKGSFQISKVTYDPDERKVVFLLKTQRQFAFTDDGFVAPLRFFDEDGVNLVQGEGTNLKFEADITKLKVGEMTRMYLTLPDEDTLKKAKKGQAVIKGFFANPDKK